MQRSQRPAETVPSPRPRRDPPVRHAALVQTKVRREQLRRTQQRRPPPPMATRQSRQMAPSRPSRLSEGRRRRLLLLPLPPTARLPPPLKQRPSRVRPSQRHLVLSASVVPRELLRESLQDPCLCCQPCFRYHRRLAQGRLLRVQGQVGSRCQASQWQRSKGFGFVDFEDNSEQQRAVSSAQNKEIDGRQVTLQVCSSNDKAEAEAAEAPAATA